MVDAGVEGVDNELGELTPGKVQPVNTAEISKAAIMTGHRIFQVGLLFTLVSNLLISEL